MTSIYLHAAAAEVNFITMDPPEHTIMRKLAQPGFLPNVVNTFRGRAEEIVQGCIDQALEADEIDIVDDFAVPITVGMITTVLGLPIEDLPMIRQWTMAMADGFALPNFLTERDPERATRIVAAADEMGDYFEAFVSERERHPIEGDIVELLMESEADGVSYSREQLVSTLILLLTAGNDSTTNLISNYITTMAQFPDQADLVRNDLSLVNKSIEEQLRYCPSFLGFERSATADHELHGVEINKGDTIMVWIAAANRDPRAYDRPDEVDIMRPRNRHIGFGHGIHFCIGAPFARMESQIAARTLMDRVGSIELRGEPVLGGNAIMNGPAHQRAVLTAK